MESAHAKALEKAKQSVVATIKTRHGSGARSKATTAAWLAQLCQMDRGRIAASNSVAAVNSFDDWKADGGSFELRPLTRSSIGRKLRERCVDFTHIPVPSCV